MDSAFAWKQFYAAEPLDVRDGGAIVIPHTRIEVTGNQIAVAVATVLASGAETSPGARCVARCATR